ncbi:hypothetical protein FOCC_FOCC017782, partial [Frankliniella occidentalis]
ASATEPVSVQAEVTLATNYFALVDFCNEIFPLLRPHARVVNISSSSGHLLRIPGEEIRKQFLNPDLSVDLLSKLMQSYVTAAKNGNHEALGWGSSSYVVSKVGVSKLSFIQQATFDKNGPEDVIVNAVHPGYVDTDMTSHKGPLTIEEAEVTLATNYFALVDFCNEIFPLLRPHARVVNISSSCGHLLRIPGEEIRKQFLNPNLSVDELSELMQNYVTAAKNGNQEALGWGSGSYNVSKVGVSKLSFIQQAMFDKNGPEDVIVNAVHPGYVDTDMTSHKGPLTIEEGAAAAIYLSLLPQNIAQPRGAYIWHDKRVVDWTKPPPAVV